jgi:hypothetical protein
MEREDPNVWWRLECGHHQNLFDEVVEEVERLREVAERAHDAFLFMPALNGSYPATVDDVRREVEEAIDGYWDDLCKVLGRTGRP